MKQPNPYRFLRAVRPCELAVLLKWILRASRREVALDGVKMWLDPASDLGVRLLDEGDYEPSVGRCLRQLLRPGDVFLDVGANEGWFTVLAARLVEKHGRVFAIEPQARLWPVILRNCELNRLSNCTLLPFAINSTPGEAGLRPARLKLAPTINSGASTFVPGSRRARLRRALWKTQRVAAVPLDNLAALRQTPRIHLAKVDVEGYELEVVRSAEQLMVERRIERWLIETHPPQLSALGTSVAELESLLAKHGYRNRSVEGAVVWELS